MELHHQYYFFTLFSVIFVVSHAANLSPEVYWRVKLPNTPMPTPIKDALHISAENELHKVRQSYGVNRWYQVAPDIELHKVRQPYGVNRWYQAAPDNELHKVRQPYGVNRWYQAAPDNELHKVRQPYGVNRWYQAAPDNELHKVRQPYGVNRWYQAAPENELQKVRQPYGVNRWYQAAPDNELHKVRQPYGVNRWYQAAPDNELHKVRQPYGVNRWYQAARDNELHKVRQPYGVYAWYQAAPDNELHKVRQPWGVYAWYNDAAKKDLNDNHPVTPFFFETDLHQGKKMNLESLKNYNPAPILPRKVVDSIAFSSDKIEEILNHFSIDKDSEHAKDIKKTIKMCEEPAGNGEIKHCATSLESMIDFTLSHLGTNNIIAISTEVEKETPEVQTYTIERVEEKANGKGVVCHKVAYPYAVHFCHDVGSTRTFMVSMVGADGTKVNAVSVCHEDTASMNPKALPFQLLNVKPGDKPICHFTLDDQIALFPSQNALAEN
ncbi:hypothetical protein AABB24_034391 [Solanum stoloniferum]|uniref:BURP domain-containing protein n=1 Tax=Solanum stoloniferum TaxID=62892 RepID=A0ABD2RGB9_9SOLN